MSLPKCPCQEDCVNYETGSNKPKNHDVRNKYICATFLKGCEDAMWYQTKIMGLPPDACEITKGGKK